VASLNSEQAFSSHRLCLNDGHRGLSNVGNQGVSPGQFGGLRSRWAVSGGDGFTSLLAVPREECIDGVNPIESRPDIQRWYRPMPASGNCAVRSVPI